MGIKASDIDVGKLHDAVHDSFRELARFRVKRNDYVKLYAGNGYAANDGVMESPENLIELAVGIYTFLLSSDDPKADVKTDYRRLRPAAGILKLALDHVSPRLKLGETIRKCVKDAMFGWGIVKVGVNSTRFPIRGFTAEFGQPFVEHVSADDFVYDTTAKDWRDVQFVGSRLAIDGDAARRSGIFPRMSPLSATMRKSMGSSDGLASDIGTGVPQDISRYRDRLVVWEIWLPYENAIVTLDEECEKVLKVQEWTGPRTGPYHLLFYSDVPDNVLPLPPVALWESVHVFTNEIWRKVFRQGRRQKTVTAFSGGNKEDAERIRNAGDGDVVRVDDARGVNEIRFGGPDQALVALGGIMGPSFSRMAGNLDTAGGLAPMGDTATQDVLLNQNSSVRFKQMALSVSRFAKGIMESLAWWMWTDPGIELPLVLRVGSFELDVTFDQGAKAGDFLDYSFDIVPYSMTPKPPEERFRELASVLQMLFQPYAELAMQAGIVPDIRELFRLASEMLDIPELNSVLSIGDPVDFPMRGHDAPLVEKPPQKRVYERVSRSVNSHADRMGAFSRAFAGENLQPKERAMGGV